MRPIKFRYIFDATENDSGIQIQEYTIEEIEENEPYNFMDCCFTTSAKITRLQFTGLLNKNGKEIYEGDILKIQKSHEKNEKIVSCIWGNIGGWLFQQHKTPYSLIDSEEFSYYESEIIGNIYQNPELIK